MIDRSAYDQEIGTEMRNWQDSAVEPKLHANVGGKALDFRASPVYGSSRHCSPGPEIYGPVGTRYVLNGILEEVAVLVDAFLAAL
jgi:hypothetical protein